LQLNAKIRPQLAGCGGWQEACRREAVIRPLAEQDPVSREAAIAAAKQLGISSRLVYRLVARFRRRPQTISLVPGVRGRAARSRSLDPRVEALVASAIKEVYLRPERPRLIDLWRAVRAQCLPLGLKPPAYHTLQARVQQCDARVILQARAGAAAARQRYDRVKPSSLQPSWPLEVVQIDHTPIDVLVVDEWERQPLGRPWLTLAIDVASRFVIGFQVSLDRPSSLTVALVLNGMTDHYHKLQCRILNVPARSARWASVSVDTLPSDLRPTPRCWRRPVVIRPTSTKGVLVKA
jgi:putative transposase